MKVVTAAIENEKYDKLAEIAKREHRSVSNLVSLFLSRCVNGEGHEANRAPAE